ncbi:MAG: guanylate kinase [Chloroflexi bacterium]|nr:guanylate kinase [Chloroflexota bacterium]
MTDQAHPLLVVISGPSGVGKDAVLERMKRLERPWHYVVTATTRAPRPGERDGEEYIFLDTARFEEMVTQDRFLEHAEVYGHRYGVPRDQVEEALRSGRDVIAKTDVQGARTLRAAVPGATLVFIAAPSMEELEARLRGRKTDRGTDLRRRLKTAREEMERQGEFDHVVVNHQGRLEETVAAIERIIQETKRRAAGRGAL